MKELFDCFVKAYYLNNRNQTQMFANLLKDTFAVDVKEEEAYNIATNLAKEGVVIKHVNGKVQEVVA